MVLATFSPTVTVAGRRRYRRPLQFLDDCNVIEDISERLHLLPKHHSSWELAHHPLAGGLVALMVILCRQYHPSTGVLAFLHDTGCLTTREIAIGRDGFLSTGGRSSIFYASGRGRVRQPNT